MERQDSEQLPVALYNLSDVAKNELERLVTGNDEGYLIGTELERRTYTLDSFCYQLPCTFFMHDFQRHKIREDEWISKPFYTRPQGYKMCLSVFANGSGEGKGTHVSVRARNEFARLVKGKTNGSLRNQELQRRAYALDSFLLEPCVQFIMRDFQRHKRKEDEWLSKPFYTYAQGYKMCLSVDAKGDDDGWDTHVSVYVHIMWGEFDYDLDWPFCGSVTIQLLDQSGRLRSRNVTTTLSFDAYTPRNVTSRVTDREMNHGWGKPQFVAHENLGAYLEEDCLLFRVVECRVES